MIIKNKKPILLCESHTKWAGRGGVPAEKHLFCSGWAWTTLELWGAPSRLVSSPTSGRPELTGSPGWLNLWFTAATITIMLDVVRLFSLPKLSPLHEWKAFVYGEDFSLVISCLLDFTATYSLKWTNLHFSLSESHWGVVSSAPCILRYLLLSLSCLPGSELHITARGCG